MIRTVVVGHGLAGRSFHCPLIRRQPGLKLHGIVARDPAVRAEAVALWGEGVRGYARLDEALADPAVELVVIATPHDSHAELAVRALEAGKHCVVDKVMALSTDGGRPDDRRPRPLGPDAVGLPQPPLGLGLRDRQGGPRARAGSAGRCSSRAPSAAHARAAQLARQRRGRRHDPPRLGRAPGRPGPPARPGPCRRLAAWLIPGPWEGVDSGGHGRIVLEFDDVLFQVETSRICRIDRPRWWIVGTDGGFVKFGVDPQEDALRAGDIDAAAEPPQHRGHPAARGRRRRGRGEPGPDRPRPLG